MANSLIFPAAAPWAYAERQFLVSQRRHHHQSNFESGYNLSQAAVPLPQNDYSQHWAVLDGMGCGENNGNICGNLSTNPPLAPTYAQMNAVLKDVTQTAYPTTGASTGVFLPYTCSGGTCTLNTNAGGLYVEGTASSANTTVTFSTANGSGGSSNPSAQVIQVAQTGTASGSSSTINQTAAPSCTHTSGWSGTTYTCTASYQQVTTSGTPTTITTVTIDSAAATTTVASYVSTSTSTKTSANTAYSCTGSSPCTPPVPTSISGGTTATSSTNGATTTLNLAGVPENLTSGTAAAGTMVYVDGDVSVTGPSSGAAIQNNSMVTLTANGDITQTGDLKYATEPVTTTQNQVISGSSPACCNGDPVDTLIPSVTNMNQVLGLYTATGEFQLSPASNNQNMETDASIAMISTSPTSSSGKFATPGNSVGTWTNIGGRVENSINGVSINTSNVYFDRRFTARSNFAPPWFPQTSIAIGDIIATTTAVTTITPQRVQWVTTSGGQ